MLEPQVGLLARLAQRTVPGFGCFSLSLTTDRVSSSLIIWTPPESQKDATGNLENPDMMVVLIYSSYNEQPSIFQK